MNIGLPDGSTLQNVPDGTTQLDIIQRLKAGNNANWQPLAEAYTAKYRTNPITEKITQAIGEPALEAASGLYHAVKGGYEAIGRVAQSLGKGESLETGLRRGASDIKAEESQAYKPESKVGQVASEIASAPGRFQQKAAKYVGNKVQSGATALGASPEVAAGAGTVADTALQFAAPTALLKKKAPGSSLSTETAFPDATKSVPKDPGVTAELTKLARSRGYVLKPSEAGGLGGKIAEGLAGSPKLSAEMSIKNQKVTNRLIAEEHQLPEGTRVTRGNLAVAKKPWNAAYKEAAGLGDIEASPAYVPKVQSAGRTPGTSFQKGGEDPDIARLKEKYADPKFNAKDAVLHVRQLRADAVKNIKAPNAPKQNELGYVQRQIADAIDDELDLKAEASGNPGLKTRLQKARKELAKIHTTEAALVGNTGDVSAQKLAQMQDRGIPLDGNQKIIADIATEFGEVTRTGTKVKNKTPFSVLEGAFGVAGASLHHPGYGAAIVARPATRQFLMSDMYQNKLGAGPRKPTVGDIENP